jgi:hypothetical protein
MDKGAESRPHNGGGPPGSHRSNTSHARAGAQRPSHPKHHSAQMHGESTKEEGNRRTTVRGKFGPELRKICFQSRGIGQGYEHSLS